MLKRFIQISLFLVMILSSGTFAAEVKEPLKEELTVDISYQQADLIGVLQELSEKAGFNLVTAPDVQGNVSITLKNVTYGQALRIIVMSLGYIYEQEGSCFFVSKPEQVVTEQNNIAFFPVYYTDSKMLAELLVKTLGAGERIVSDDRDRIIIVKGSKTLIERVEKIIKALDRKMPQITVEVKLIAVSTTAVRKMGMEIMKGIDRDKSVMDWGETSSGLQIIIDLVRGGQNWSAILKNLISNGHARLITAPSVSTMNGQESSIVIADQIPIETSDEDGNINVNYVDVGIKPLFTPTVQQGDELFLDLTTQVSSLGDKMGSSYKIINKEIKSRIQARIGETVFLGGLISQEEQSTMSKVPILGDLPLLKKIFSTDYKQNYDSELIITLTPRWTESIDTVGKIEQIQSFKLKI